MIKLHRHTAPVGIVQPIDQMEISRPAASGAHRQVPGQVSLGSGGECGCLFMSHSHPPDIPAPADGIGNPVERVARYAIHSLDPNEDQAVDQELRHCFLAHGALAVRQIRRGRKRGFNFTFFLGDFNVSDYGGSDLRSGLYAHAHAKTDSRPQEIMPSD